MQNLKVERVNKLLLEAEEALLDGNEVQAADSYRRILKIDPDNEKALVWLSWHTTDAYEARNTLRRIAARYPNDKRLQYFLQQAEKRCEELDQLVNSSEYLQHWQNTEDMMRERLRRNRDLRPEGVSRIGEMLLRHGYINQDQLDNAVDLQTMFRGLGETRKLGELLVDCGYVKQELLQSVLREQDIDFQSQFY